MIVHLAADGGFGRDTGNHPDAQFVVADNAVWVYRKGALPERHDKDLLAVYSMFYVRWVEP